MEEIDAPNYFTCAYIHDYTCVRKENWHKRSPNLKHSTSFNQFRILESSSSIVPMDFHHTIRGTTSSLLKQQDCAPPAVERQWVKLM